MSLTRAYEEHEVSPEVRRIYADIRQKLDLPFVPTIFKLSAAMPDFLKRMWADLDDVAASREFHAASKALSEFAWSQVTSAGWHFADQQKELAGQKFSVNDVEFLRGVAALFQRETARMALFTRLMQRGYSGGQKGRVSASKQASAISRMAALHIPNERDAGLRLHLIYSDIKKTTASKSVLSTFRVLAPFPGYLASVWQESKKLIADPGFRHEQDELNRRTLGLMVGLPVKDHRAAAKSLSPEQWREVEEMVDGFVRLLPQAVLLATIWQRSFLQTARLAGAA